MKKSILTLFLVTILFGMAESFCCGCPGTLKCAALGGCNIFCCDCEGSCQRGRICHKHQPIETGEELERRKRFIDREQMREEFSAWNIILGRYQS